MFHPYVATAGCEGKSKLYECPANVQSCPKKGVVRSGLHWCTVDTKQLDAPLQDMVTTNATLQHLELAVSKHPDKPFFIGLGIHKPHMPFLYPDEFLQLLVVRVCALTDDFTSWWESSDPNPPALFSSNKIRQPDDCAAGTPDQHGECAAGVVARRAV